MDSTVSILFTRAVLINAIASEACIKANYGILLCTSYHVMYVMITYYMYIISNYYALYVMYVMITYYMYIISNYYAIFPPFVDITLLRQSDVVSILCYK